MEFDQSVHEVVVLGILLLVGLAEDPLPFGGVPALPDPVGDVVEYSERRRKGSTGW